MARSLLSIGIPDEQTNQEAIDLRFRKWIGTRLLHRILCGQHQKGLGETAGVALDSDLRLLHGFEQRRLSFGRSTVDLVTQHHVGKDGTLAKRKRTIARREHVGPGDVGGQKVWGELDPSKTSNRA